MEALLQKQRELGEECDRLCGLMDHISSQLAEMGLLAFQNEAGVACNLIQVASWPWAWNPAAGEWQADCDYRDYDSGRRVLQSYASYPPQNAKASAARVWSQFTVAFEAPPITLKRLFMAGFRAIYKDARGQELVVPLDSIIIDQPAEE